jgi:hypothetical protein
MTTQMPDDGRGYGLLKCDAVVGCRIGTDDIGSRQARGWSVRAIITTELAGTNPSNAGIAAKTSVAVLKRMFCMSFPLL